MNLQEALEKNIPNNIRFDEWPEAVEQLGPIIERAVRAAYFVGWSDGTGVGNSDNGITAFVAAMVEKS